MLNPYSTISMGHTSKSITCKECKNIFWCFSMLLPAELDFIDHYKVQINYSRGEDICKQGAFASSIIYILIRENGVFASEIVKWHCHIETHHYKKIQNLACKQLHGRLADTIIYLDKEDFGLNNVFQYLTRKDLAELSAMSTEGAVRILSEFDKDGIIELKGKDIKILDLEKLMKISRAG